MVSGFGLLANDMGIDLQKLNVILKDDLDSFSCGCQKPDSDPPIFGIEFCDFDEASDGFIGATAAETCNAAYDHEALAIPLSEGASEPLEGSSGSPRESTSEILYGAELEENYWYGEGCNPQFWEENPDIWPSKYLTDDEFNDAFFTDLAIYRILVTEGEGSIDETITPMRGRVTSDGVSVGTATLAREPSDTQDSSTSETSTEQVATLEVLSRGNTTSGRVNATSYDLTPTLVTMLRTPEIFHVDGGLNLLGREAVAALLNSAHPDINYYYDEATIRFLTQMSIDMGPHYDHVINELIKLNSRGEETLCP